MQFPPFAEQTIRGGQKQYKVWLVQMCDDLTQKQHFRLWLHGNVHTRYCAGAFGGNKRRVVVLTLTPNIL